MFLIDISTAKMIDIYHGLSINRYLFLFSLKTKRKHLLITLNLPNEEITLVCLFVSVSSAAKFAYNISTQ